MLATWNAKTTAPVTVLSVSREVTIPGISLSGAEIGRFFESEIERHGLKINGPWIFVAHDLPHNATDRFTVDFCLSVEKPESYAGQFTIRDLPPLPCAAAMYEGKLEGLFPRGYGPLVAEINRNGLGFTGESREIYHRWIGPESPDNRIELQFGVN